MVDIFHQVKVMIDMAVRDHEKLAGSQEKVISNTKKLKGEMKEGARTTDIFNWSNRRLYVSMLTLMFTMRGMSRTFGGIIRTVLESAGILDFFHAAVVSLTPAFSPLIDSIADALGWFINLDEGWKKLIASGIVIMALFAGIIGLIATTTLAFAALASYGVALLVVQIGALVTAFLVLLYLMHKFTDIEVAQRREIETAGGQATTPYGPRPVELPEEAYGPPLSELKQVAPPTNIMQQNTFLVDTQNFGLEELENITMTENFKKWVREGAGGLLR